MFTSKTRTLSSMALAFALATRDSSTLSKRRVSDIDKEILSFSMSSSSKFMSSYNVVFIV